MAVKCPRCRSTETQTLINSNQCLTCGGLFDFAGKPAESGFDQSTRDVLQSKLEPRRVVVVGNFADLQRGAVVQPPGTEFRETVTPAEDDARKGEITVNANPQATSKAKASAKK